MNPCNGPGLTSDMARLGFAGYFVPDAHQAIMFISRATSLALAIFFAAANLGWCGDPGWKTLPDHVPSVVARLAPQGSLPATNQLSLAIGLPLRHQSAMDELLRELYDPQSPNFHQFLTPDEFTARFGPTEADYAAVKVFARNSGFQITGTHGNRLLLDVRAKVADIQRAFHLNLQTFKHPRETRDFFAPDTDPTVAFGLPIADVSGLNNFQLPRPKLVKKNSAAVEVVAKSGSAPNGDLLGNDFRAAYVPDTTLTGAGQMVGLLEFDGYYPGDISAYAKKAGGGRTGIPLQTVLVDGYNGKPTAIGNGEVALDIQMAMAMAPGLAKIIVFSGGPNGLQNDVLNAMAASNAVKNLSCSWGWDGGPNMTTDAIFQQMAAQGQSFFNASGDSDAFTTGVSSVNGVDKPSLANAPSSSPYITQVGGTTLMTTGPGGGWQSETVWNWGGGTGSGGGISSYYSIPAWQSGVSMTASHGSATKRNIPDVALVADNIYSYYDNGQSGSIGGTSCAAPLWAGLTALANQQAAATGKPAVGFINPTVYAIGEGPGYALGFHDITTGNNTSSASPSLFYAVTGYDLCTGWGTPAGQSLIDALTAKGNPVTGSLGIASNPQLTASGEVGGPFSPASAIITLTNSGGAPLTWALLNSNAVSWLKVSATGGILNRKVSTNLLVSFTAAVNRLAVGNYSASFKFTNLTTAAVQPVSFQLQVLPVLSAQPATGFTASGPVGGPFIPAAQIFTISNLGATSALWKVVESSAWLAVDPTSGTLAAGRQSKFTVSLTAQANTLATGSYKTSVTVRNQKNQIVQILPVTLTIRPKLVAAPQIQNVTRAPASIAFTFITTAGARYQVQYKTNLLQPDWINLGGRLMAQTNSLPFTDTNIVNDPQKFYRLMLVP